MIVCPFHYWAILTNIIALGHVASASISCSTLSSDISQLTESAPCGGKADPIRGE